MELKGAANNILEQLEEMLLQIKDEDLCKPSPILNQATIGQHLRHILEFFTCLETGVRQGKVNYDEREHDEAIETSKILALEVITQIRTFVNQYTSDYNLWLEGNYEVGSDNTFQVKSNYQRELVYNLEHAIHHMALIKIGIQENAEYISLPVDFGVASSTIRYLETK